MRIQSGMSILDKIVVVSNLTTASLRFYPLPYALATRVVAMDRVTRKPSKDTAQENFH